LLLPDGLPKVSSSPVFANRETPVLLRGALGAVWVLALILCAVVLQGWQLHRQVVQTIGLDSAPSVEAAHSIQVLVETLDASLVNELLLPPGRASDHVQAFEKARIELGVHLVAAAKNITYGDAERLPLERIQDATGRYLMDAQAARSAAERGNGPAMLDRYREAYGVLKGDLLPATVALNDANESVLRSAYQTQETKAQWVVALDMLFGAALLAVLGAAQWFFVKRFRRILNPGFAAATLVVLWLLVSSVRAFVANGADVKAMKEDAYDSVAALLDSRAHAYEANAAESRWLLDPQMRVEHDRTFTTYLGRLAAIGVGQTWEGVAALGDRRNAIYAQLVKKGDTGVEAGAIVRSTVPIPGFSGSLAKGMDNVTFPDPDPAKDEPTQSLATLKAFGQYVELDAKIRSLENAGRHADAVRFCMGMAPGESNRAFFDFDESLGRWLAINQTWMERYRDSAFGDVESLLAGAPVALLAVLALTFVGLRPRLREYGE
jgi:hypothetical protein